MTNFKVMKVKLKTLNEFLKKPTIFKTNKNPKSVILPFNGNSFFLYQDENRAIELKVENIPLFDLFYHYLKQQLKSLG